MSLRDWLILIGVLVVTGILVDGVRRMRKRNRISLKIDKQYENLPDVDLSAELPNGGARRASHHPGVSAAAPATAAAVETASSQARGAAALPDISESLVASRADSDVDLLLDGDFKGVGQGADDYLSVSRPVASAKSHRADADAPVQNAGEAEQTPAAEKPAANPSAVEVDLLSEGESLLGRSRGSMPPAPQPPADSPTETAEDDFQTTATAHQHSAAVDEPHTQPAHSTAASTLAPVAAADEDLDLSQPVTLLMAQMQERKTVSQSSMAAAAVPKAASETQDAARAAIKSEKAEVDKAEVDKAEVEKVGIEQAETASDAQTANVQTPIEAKHPASAPSAPEPNASEQRASNPRVAEKAASEAMAVEQAVSTDTEANPPVEVEETTPGYGRKTEQPAASERIEPTLGAATDDLLLDAGLDAPLTAESRADDQAVSRPELGANAPAATEPEKPKTKKSALTRLREEIQISFFDDLELAEESPVPDEAAQSANSKKAHKNAKQARADKRAQEQNADSKQGRDTRDKKPWEKKAGSFLSRRKKPDAAVEEPSGTSPSQPVAEEEPPLLVMHVAGREPLSGPLLFKLVEACGMEFGDMQIYHRYEDGPGQGAVQFSMVNAYKPGVFDPDERDSFSTPGVNFFLDMSEPKDLMNAFECMLATAQCLCDNLNAVLKDEHLSVMRPQTIEHYRQQIIEFERRRLAKRA